VVDNFAAPVQAAERAGVVDPFAQGDRVDGAVLVRAGYAPGSVEDVVRGRRCSMAPLVVGDGPFRGILSVISAALDKCHELQEEPRIPSQLAF
jgi:hypothetical protein